MNPGTAPTTNLCWRKCRTCSGFPVAGCPKGRRISRSSRGPASCRAARRRSAIRIHVSDIMQNALARGLSPLLAVACEHELGVPLDRLDRLTYLGFKEGPVWLAVTRLPLDRIAIIQTMTPGAGEYTFKGRKFH